MGMAIFSPTASRPPVLALIMVPLQELFALLSAARRPSVPVHNPSPGMGSRAVLPSSCKAIRAIDKAPWRASATGAIAVKKVLEKNASNPTTPSRLRVVRAFDPGVAPSCAGRMVISGRMADVCAELDRMTQKDAFTCLR